VFDNIQNTGALGLQFRKTVTSTEVTGGITYNVKTEVVFLHIGLFVPVSDGNALCGGVSSWLVWCNTGKSVTWATGSYAYPTKWFSGRAILTISASLP
jgi:hypothetical protein